MRTLFTTALLFACALLSAQTQMLETEIFPPSGQADTIARPTYVPPPNLLLRSGPTSQFLFQYSDTLPPPEASKAAIEMAGEIWSYYINSIIPIEVLVVWRDRGSEPSFGVPKRFIKGAAYLPTQDHVYPIALVQAIEKREIDFGSSPQEILIILNSEYDWYFGTDGRVPEGHYDLLTNVLQDIGHGLGLYSHASVNEELKQGGFWTGVPTVYDKFIRTYEKGTITLPHLYPRLSLELYQALTSDSLFFEDPLVGLFNNNNSFVKVYAPEEFTFRDLSHIDNGYPPQGEPRSLMTPHLAPQEAIHRPEKLVLAMLDIIGWEVNYSPTVITNTAQLETGEIQLFPNPAQDYIQLRWPEDLPQQVAYQLTDLSGRLIQQGQLAQGQTLALNGLSPGQYQLILQANQKTYIGRFLVR
ncbi:MAG: T9SS type A sorting domain-containing protein [Bacteroidota bacterium]